MEQREKKEYCGRIPVQYAAWISTKMEEEKKRLLTVAGVPEYCRLCPRWKSTWKRFK